MADSNVSVMVLLELLHVGHGSPSGAVSWLLPQSVQAFVMSTWYYRCSSQLLYWIMKTKKCGLRGRTRRHRDVGCDCEVSRVD